MIKFEFIKASLWYILEVELLYLHDSKIESKISDQVVRDATDYMEYEDVWTEKDKHISITIPL